MKKILFAILIISTLSTTHANQHKSLNQASHRVSDPYGFSLSLSAKELATELAKLSLKSATQLIEKHYKKLHNWLYPSKPLPPFPIEQAAKDLGHDTLSAALIMPLSHTEGDDDLEISIKEFFCYLLR